MYGIDQIGMEKASAKELRKRKAVTKLLLHKELLKIDFTQGEPIYSITEKGLEFLRNYTEFELYRRRFGALRVNL